MSEKKTDARVNNAQRKAIVCLAERRFEKLIQQARDKNGELTQQITDRVKRELGVVAVEKQIDELKSKVEFLEKTKERLGFSGYSVIGKAKVLIDQRSRQASKEIATLEQTKDEFLQRIWLCQTVQETEGLLATIPVEQ